MSPPVERRANAGAQKAKINAVMWLAGAAVLIVLIVAMALSVASLMISSDVNSNAGSIRANAADIEAVEVRDRNALRGASYRTCEREQRDRAEQHLRAGLSPPAAIARLVHRLGLPANLAERVSIEAVRKRLPIFDCTPNLVGRQARALTENEQVAYVKRYAAGKLDPTP